jgi:hypothetical protein
MPKAAKPSEPISVEKTYARQIGHCLPQKAVFGMWEWGSR